jgi:hypothetical protein
MTMQDQEIANSALLTAGPSVRPGAAYLGLAVAVDAQPVFDAIVKSCSGLFPDAAVVIALPDNDLIKAVASPSPAAAIYAFMCETEITNVRAFFD